MPRHLILRVKSIIKITTKLFWNNSDFHDMFMVIPLKIPTVYALTNHQNLQFAHQRSKALKQVKKVSFTYTFQKMCIFCISVCILFTLIIIYIIFIYMNSATKNVEIIIYNTVNSSAIILWQSRRKNDLKIYMNDMIQRG